MTPEERALIDGLFNRMREVSNQPRDAEAEALIARNVSQMPYAPYALAQTVLVQEHALQQASARIEELEAQVRQSQPAQSSGGFLGGLLGGRGTSVPSAGGRVSSMSGGMGGTAGGAMPLPSQGQPYGQPYGQPANMAPPASGPWGGQPAQPSRFGGGFGGGGFLQGAMATAAGVAGGMLLADGIRNLMSSGTGPLAEQAALLDPATPAAAVEDLGNQAQDALGGAPAADPWAPEPQDASFDPGGNGWDGDAGWDPGGGDDGGGDWT